MDFYLGKWRTDLKKNYKSKIRSNLSTWSATKRNSVTECEIIRYIDKMILSLKSLTNCFYYLVESAFVPYVGMCYNFYLIFMYFLV